MIARKYTAKGLWKPKRRIEAMYKKSLSKLMKQLDKNLIGLKRPTDIENADDSTDSMADIPGISDSSNFNLPSIDSRKLFDGGEGSGNFGHEGRPGQISGSGEGGENGELENNSKKSDSCKENNGIIDTGESIKNNIKSGKYPLTINKQAQNKHIPGTNDYKEGRSVLTISSKEAQELVNKWNLNYS